jgi:hypothetical protein
MDFIRSQQADVLARAVAELRDCEPADLRSVAHAIHGTLGSYQLDDAHEQIAALSSVLADPGTTPDDAESARVRTIAALEALQASAQRSAAVGP